ncbi:MAG: hypothetical protein L0Z53_09825 [Acidobacteriales bacterium]|nr:hypothetical protein [Terriglobales bacterium]
MFEGLKGEGEKGWEDNHPFVRSPFHISWIAYGPFDRAIYMEGIATGQATLETEAPAWREWDAGHLPVCRLAARQQGVLLGWAALSPVSRRRCYTGVAEVSVYVGVQTQLRLPLPVVANYFVPRWCNSTPESGRANTVGDYANASIG